MRFDCRRGNVRVRAGMRKAWPAGVLVALASAGTVSPSARAQGPDTPFLQQQRAIEEEVRAEFNREVPIDRKVNVDWGGWYNFSLFIWDDGVVKSRTFRRHDMRLWASASLDQGAHEFYGRLKLQYDDFNSGQSYDGNDKDWVGPNLDRGFYQFDLRRAVRAYANRELDWNLRAKVGRDFVDFGTGYALSLPLDHVLLSLELGDIELQGLFGNTVRSMDDINALRPGGYDMDRNIIGTQVSYTGIENHRPFFYAFWNEDRLSEDRTDFWNNYDYDSYYLGIGADGDLSPTVNYMTEWVFEGGQSYGPRRGLFNYKQNNVCAWAFDQEIEYMPNVATKPRLSAEYMFASGDPNREFSATGVIGGNATGTDNAFMGFGYRNTGLAFAPYLTNIHIWRLGGAFVPFEDVEVLRDFEVGSDFFLYARNRSHGAVTDPTADVPNGYLGWEMDWFANWRLTSDLSLTTRLGTFFPGRSFSDESPRSFWLMGVWWSF